MEIIIAALGGTALAALINKVGEYIIMKKKHKYRSDDEDDMKITALMDGVRYLLLMSIKEHGLKYLQDGSISFEDRRTLHKMHNVYHNKLDGNGDLDELMKDIDNLPLKSK